MHIDKELLEAFQKNELELNEYIEILEHMKSCDHCAAQLASLEEEVPLQAPRYLKDQIIKRTQLLDIRASDQLQRSTKNMQLLFYSLRTTTVVAGALLILFAVSKMDELGINTGMGYDREYTVSGDPKQDAGTDQDGSSDTVYAKFKSWIENNRMGESGGADRAYEKFRQRKEGAGSGADLTQEIAGKLSEGSNQMVEFINEFSNKIVNGGNKR